MEHQHRRLSDEQIGLIIQNYCEGKLSRKEVQDALEIGKSRFFDLLKTFRKDPQGFSIEYQRSTPRKITPETEDLIQHELQREMACPPKTDPH